MSVYLAIICLIIVVPAVLSRDARIAYIHRYPAVLASFLIVGPIFVFWDVLATARGDWVFNTDYIIGWRLLGVPMEEFLFFAAVPYSCLFIYNVISFFVKDRRVSFSSRAMGVLCVLALALAVVNRDRSYTFTVALVAALTILVGLIVSPRLFRSRNYWMFLGIATGAFMVVNYVLTSLPVVVYDETVLLGPRVLTIPVEDFLYNFAMVTLYLMVYLFYEERVRSCLS